MNELRPYEMTWGHLVAIVLAGAAGVIGYWLPYFMERGVV